MNTGAHNARAADGRKTSVCVKTNDSRANHAGCTHNLHVHTSASVCMFSERVPMIYDRGTLAFKASPPARMQQYTIVHNMLCNTYFVKRVNSTSVYVGSHNLCVWGVDGT